MVGGSQERRDMVRDALVGSLSIHPSIMALLSRSLCATLGGLWKQDLSWGAVCFSTKNCKLLGMQSGASFFSCHPGPLSTAGRVGTLDLAVSP